MLINSKNNDVFITTDKKANSNENCFDVNTDIISGEVYWNSNNANKFRKSFKNCINKKPRSNEHRIESYLLSEFKKNVR